MKKIRGHVTINIEKCKGCELCLAECPQDSLSMSKNINKQGYNYALLIKDNCTGCTNCALVCPEAVINVYRQNKNKMTAMAPDRNLVNKTSITIN
ncbi:MAG: ferredoxin family protein [Candidatus Neomarinimicrobiota bacterium]